MGRQVMQKTHEDIVSIRRRQLTAAAYKLVRKKGYYNFTIKDIAREARLSTALVHYYFKNKEDLLFTLLKQMNENLKHVLDRELSMSQEPAEKLQIFIDQSLTLLERENSYFQVLIEFWTQINRSEHIRRANVKLYESLREQVASILKEGVEKRVFAKIDVHRASTIIVSLLHGTITQYFLDDQAFDYAGFRKDVTKHIMGMVGK